MPRTVKRNASTPATAAATGPESERALRVDRKALRLKPPVVRFVRT